MKLQTNKCLLCKSILTEKSAETNFCERCLASTVIKHWLKNDELGQN